MAHCFTEGQHVRFSEIGRAKVRTMPEAWGLHRALYGEEVGEVIDYNPAEEDAPEAVSVEFPSGGAHHWDPECFEPMPDAPDRISPPITFSEPAHSVNSTPVVIERRLV